MAQQPMFVITKSGLTIRPEGIDLAIAYTRHYTRHLGELLAEYQREAARARTVAPEGIPQEESIVADTKRELNQAGGLIADLEQVKGHVIHAYDRNFEAWAQVFRQARIERRLESIEESPDLYTAMKIAMAMLKAENPKFNEERFRAFINRDTEEPIITREVQGLSTTQPGRETHRVKGIFEELAEVRKEGRQPLCPECHEPLIIEETMYIVRVWRWDAQMCKYRMGILDEGRERPGCLKCRMEFGRFWIGQSPELCELGIDYSPLL